MKKYNPRKAAFGKDKKFFSDVRILIAIGGAMFLAILLPIVIYSPLLQTSNKQHASGGTPPMLGGCQLFPSDNVWNDPISSLPLNQNSDNYVAHIGSTGTLQNDFGDTPSWGIPYNVVSGTTPFVTINLTTYDSKSIPGPYPIPSNALVEQGSDHHVLVLDSGNCNLYELWSASVNSDGSWTAQSGTVFNLNSDTLVPPNMVSADAGNFAILPGLVKYDEAVSGSINHAIRVVIADPQNTYVWPATHSDGISTDQTAPPYGTRFRLKSNFDISSYSAINQAILTALKTYGMIVADKDGSMTGFQIVGAPDSRWSYSDLLNLQNIHVSDFEAVDESTLEVSPLSGAVNTGIAATPLPSSIITSTTTPCTGPTISSPFTLGATSVTQGVTITGKVTYTNECNTAITVNNIIIAARTSTGTNADFTPNSGVQILQPGQSFTLTSSRIPKVTDPTGPWYAFASYEDASNVWHPDTNFVYFAVVPGSTDSIPPTVSFTSPLNGATVHRGSKVTLTVNASDNVGVTKVAYYVNNSSLSSTTISPYSYIWNVPNKPNTTYTLQARAYDAAGNISINSVTVTAK